LRPCRGCLLRFGPLRKTRPGVSKHVVCAFHLFKLISGPPGIFKKWIIWPKDYASKARIRILCKWVCCVAPCYSSKTDFLSNSWKYRTLGRLSILVCVALGGATPHCTHEPILASPAPPLSTTTTVGWVNPPQAWFLYICEGARELWELQGTLWPRCPGTPGTRPWCPKARLRTALALDFRENHLGAPMCPGTPGNI
jgi:hypothetical protein